MDLRAGLATLLAATLAMALAAPVLAAEEEGPTRGDYVAALEPICRANSNANARILKGVKAQVRRDQLGIAGARFVRASIALGRSVKQMSRVPRPSADAQRLQRWFTYLKREQLYLLRIGKALRAGNKFFAQKQAVKLNQNNNRANNVVIAFGFRECRIDSSRFL